MATIEIRGWPEWTEDEDLQAIVDGTGQGKTALEVIRNWKAPAKSYASCKFATARQAATAAAQLNGFEFTPGYTLEAKAIAAKLPPAASSKGQLVKGGTLGPKGISKGANKRLPIDEGTVTNSDYPVANCVDAGRIEGWFLNGRTATDEKGWGQLQSFSFEGSLVFRPVYSPLLAGFDYQPKDPVGFEVVKACDGRFLAVNLALPNQEGDAPEPGEGDQPWANQAKYDLENFIAENRQWLTIENEELLRSFPEEDQHIVLHSGPLKGCRDAKKVMWGRVNNAREAAGLPPRRGEGFLDGWTEDEWATWNKGSGAWERRQANKRKNQTGTPRDFTWGNEDGTGCFFAGFDEHVDEITLQAHAETVGTVTFVKIFVDRETGRNKGCGKVFYQEPEAAERAIAELNKSMWNGRRLSVQVLGDDRKKRQSQNQKPPDDDVPQIMPLTMFNDHQSVEEKMNLCYAALEDLIANHDPVATGKGLVLMIRFLFNEINTVFEGNDEAKQNFAYRIGRHNWFWDNKQQVRFQQSKGLIRLSKVESEEKRNYYMNKGAGKGKPEEPAPAVVPLQQALQAQIHGPQEWGNNNAAAANQAEDPMLWT